MHDFIFFGSPRFAQLTLQKLLDAGYIPRAVVCSPDRPVGRKKILTASPVKLLAQKHNIPTLQPETLHDASFIQVYSGTSYAIVAAYAYIIPHSVLRLFSHGVIGVHPSLLPLYRGASPIQSALLDGVSTTGVSLYLMDEKMDHGPILTQKTCPVSEQDTYFSLEERLALLGGSLCVDILPQWLDKKIISQEQDHALAIYTRKFLTEDGKVDLENDSPISIVRKIQALHPDPGVFTYINTVRTKLCEVKKIGDNWVITKIIPEGKKERPAHIVLL